MIIPIRCYTCNQLIADKWNDFLVEVMKKDETNPQDYINHEINSKNNMLTFFKLHNIYKPCCRRHYLGHVDLIDII